MEKSFSLTDEGLTAAISAFSKSGYRFLPHDRIISLGTTYECIRFVDDIASIMNRLASRDWIDWFHLVKAEWQFTPFTVSRVHNIYRGEMDFVDQRSWGPYLDFHVRKLDKEPSESRYDVRLHLYPKFWSAELEQEISPPLIVKKDAKELLAKLAAIAQG